MYYFFICLTKNTRKLTYAD